MINTHNNTMLISSISERTITSTNTFTSNNSSITFSGKIIIYNLTDVKVTRNTTNIGAHIGKCLRQLHTKMLANLFSIITITGLRDFFPTLKSFSLTKGKNCKLRLQSGQIDIKFRTYRYRIRSRSLKSKQRNWRSIRSNSRSRTHSALVGVDSQNNISVFRRT